MLRTVMTESGVLQGVVGGDTRITVFKGVPYAAPPVGELRWRAPQRASAWSGVRRADAFAPMAIQRQPGVDPEDFYTREFNPGARDYPMDEDCLYLNIWSPALSAEERLPVYLWIHGGGYTGGYAYECEFDGERMARRGIIFVTVGYRLGAFGFLAHPLLSAEAGDAPRANCGLLDQLAAIQWLRRNIAAFGGDPDRITVGGQSAGAGAVLTHATSPMTRGLIAGVITQSGGGLRAMGYHRSAPTLAKAETQGEAFFRALGVSTLAQARALPAQRVWTVGQQLQIPWEPVIDGRFLLEDPTQAMLGNRHHDVPHLFGYNANEGPGGPACPPMPERVAQFEQMVRSRYGVSAPALLALCAARDMEGVRKTLQCDGFNNRALASLLYAQVQAQQGRRGYLYCFDGQMPGDDAGAFHGAELWFVFESLARSWRPFTGAHYDLARQICTYWTNFVKTGDPNGLDVDGRALPQWPAYTREQPSMVRFTDAPRLQPVKPDPVTAWCMRAYLEGTPYGW
ncbi:MAG: carboxylesterase/lipase family protein [Christensenellales bacterium]|jgi:para-nitrobenzyl esterase